MAATLLGGAAIGAGFGEALGRVVGSLVDLTEPVIAFKPQSTRLKTTMESIVRVIDEFTSSGALNRLDEEKFQGLVDQGFKLVGECSGIALLDVAGKHALSNKLNDFDDKLLWFFQIDMQANSVITSARILNAVSDLPDKLVQALSPATSRAGGISGSCRVPGLPEFTIGLDQRLVDVKLLLLKDTTRLFLVSGPGGFGKSTLAEKLGHDPEIKGIFRDHILYVTVSIDNSLKSIAKTLFQHYGIDNVDFKTEKDAKNQIENLIIRKKGPDKMLLILDDVWPESESVIQDLRFQIPGYKILVTSRSLLSGFDSAYSLKELNTKDANTLFRHSAFASDKNSVHNVPNDLVDKIVDFCKGIPLALIAVGSSLRGKPEVRWQATLNKWSRGQSILESHERLLFCLRISIDALDESHKKCFLDLGLFLKGYPIFGSVLMDMWVELYKHDEDGTEASEKLHELKSRNLIDLIPTRRKTECETQGHCSRYGVTWHDVLAELSVHLSREGAEAKRQRLFIEIPSNTFPEWWTSHPVNVEARMLSISTDARFDSNWNDLNGPNVEVLILNIRSKSYCLPQFIERMSQLKVLIVTGYDDFPTQLDGLQVLAYLSNLSRIRFEHVSFPSSVQVIFTLKTLKKLTFFMCKFGNALNNTIDMVENLRHLEFDLCNDLKTLPEGLCSCVSLQKLVIINCHELGYLPKELGNLSDLEILMLHGSIKLEGLPESIVSLRKLHSIDISNCSCITTLHEQTGEISSLKVIDISGCEDLKELPLSLIKLKELKEVRCDEERSHLWKNIEGDDNMIRLVEEDLLATLKNINIS